MVEDTDFICHFLLSSFSTVFYIFIALWSDFRVGTEQSEVPLYSTYCFTNKVKPMFFHKYVSTYNWKRFKTF